MFKLFAIFILIPVIVIIIVLSIISKVLGIFRPKNHRDPRRQKDTDYDDANGYHQPKRFPKEEGEYIDYEEIEDGDSK